MTESIKNYYENYDEEGRLFRDNAHLPEYLTTIRYFDRLFAEGSRILDVCAGTGRYSFYLADKGHSVTACDLAEHHVEIIKAKPNANKLDGIMVCNVLDLSQFGNDSFDVVLCMGAMYHLPTDAEKTQAIRECVRVCKPGGLVALAYINYFAAVADNVNTGLTNLDEVLAYFEDNGESESLFRVSTPAKMERYATCEGLNVLHHIGVEGLSFFLKEKVNAATAGDFGKWMELVYKHCEDPSILGCSAHGLLIGRKT